MRAIRLRLLMLLLAGPLLGACAGSDPTSVPDDPPGAFVAPASLLQALGDLRERVLPALEAERRPAMGAALTELAAALGQGQRARTQQALTAAHALVARRVPAASMAGTDDPDAADLAAIALVLAMAEAVAAGTPASGLPTP